MNEFETSDAFFKKLAESSKGEKMEFLYMGLAYISRGLTELSKKLDEINKKLPDSKK